MVFKVKKEEKVASLSAALKANMQRRKLAKKSTKEGQPKSTVELYIGLMSGTSLDGVDASLIRTDARDKVEFIANANLLYPEEFRQKLQQILRSGENDSKVETELTEFHIEAIRHLLVRAKISGERIRAIGFHGQTIYHNPAQKITKQIGMPELLATEFATDVVYDFRSRDVEFGGQGAPLVPIFHKVLTSAQDLPLVVLNIGGVANLTYIDQDNLIAFDTGPGNALINDLVQKHFNLPFDDAGLIAAKGAVDYNIVKEIIELDYFNLPYPKSLDRNHFNLIAQEKMKKLEVVDAIATVTFLTSSAIFKGIKLLPQSPKNIYLCGGGSHNRQMLQWLQDLIKGDTELSDCKMSNISQIDKSFDIDYIESGAFAYLAARFCNNLPSSFPSTTGASEPIICGRLCKF